MPIKDAHPVRIWLKADLRKTVQAEAAALNLDPTTIVSERLRQSYESSKSDPKNTPRLRVAIQNAEIMQREELKRTLRMPYFAKLHAELELEALKRDNPVMLDKMNRELRVPPQDAARWIKFYERTLELEERHIEDIRAEMDALNEAGDHED